MTTIILDLETNNKNIKDVTELWCISVLDIKTKKICTFTRHTDEPTLPLWEQFVPYLWALEENNEKITLIGHNIIAYDIPVLAKMVFKCSVSELYKRFNIIDTLVISRVLNPDIGGHSLHDWGVRLGGEQKVQNDKWDTFSPVMIERCSSDVRLTLEVYKHLCQRIK